MIKCLILGDPHIGKSLALGKAGIGATLNSRITDQINLLDWTIDHAIEHDIDHIIITGDVFEDTNPHPLLITIFISCLKKCQANNINVHIIRGNHDIFRNGFIYSSPLDIISEIELENVNVYKDIDTVIIGTTAFTMLPFRDRKSFNLSSNSEAVSLIRDSLVYELSSIPSTYCKVLIGHLAIEGSIPIGDEIDDIANELFCPLNMFEGYNYVWMGHVHKPQVMKKNNPYIAHIGSMDISNFGETDHKKHVIIFDCNGKNTWSIEHLPTRPLKKIAISIPKDTEDTTNYVLNEIKKIESIDRAIIKLEVTLLVPELKSINKSIIEKYLINNGAFSIASISESKKIILIKKDNDNNIDTKMDVISAIKMYAQTYIEEKNRSDFIQLSTSIFNNFKSEGKE